MKFKTYGDLKPINEYLQKKDLSKGYTVEIKAIEKKRSLSQNQLYWLYIACIMDETGLEQSKRNRDTIHDTLREEFLPVTTIIFDNKERKQLTSTTSLNTVQFKDYIDKIIIYSADIGIVLPNPADKFYDDFVAHYIDKI